MRTLFQLIKSCESNEKNKLVRVIDDGLQNEKALILNGAIAWESGEKKYFSKHMEEVLKISEKGVCQIGGHRIFCEIPGGRNKLVICGAGHVAISVIRMAHFLGYPVTVLEDRPEYAKKAEEAGADVVICEAFETGIKKIEGDENSFFVLMTRNHYYDQLCLGEILKKDFAYVGMIGSVRKISAITKKFLQKEEILIN